MKTYKKSPKTLFVGFGVYFYPLCRPGRTILEPIRRWPKTISEPSDLKTTVFSRFFYFLVSAPKS